MHIINVGLSALFVSTNRVMRRPFYRGTNNNVRLHVFFVKKRNEVN